MVKRAYLDRALRFHPDRHATGPESERDRAAHRMREVNAAWSVLRNPGARARYDDDLRRATPVATSASAGAPGPSSSTRRAPTTRGAGTASTRARADDAAPEPEVADLDRSDASTSARRPSVSWRMWTPIIIGGVVLAVVLIFTAYAQDDGPKVGVRTVEAYAVGTCVIVGFGAAQANPTPGEQAREQVVAARCDQPGSQEIVARVPFPKPCPRGSRAQVLADTRESLCLR